MKRPLLQIWQVAWIELCGRRQAYKHLGTCLAHDASRFRDSVPGGEIMKLQLTDQ
jgi:hypothetical protein